MGSLIKAVATSQLDEIFGFGKKKPQEEAPDNASVSAADTDTALQRIASELSDESDSIKLTIPIDRAGLVGLYLKKGGDKLLANSEATFNADDLRELQVYVKGATNKFEFDKLFKHSKIKDRLMLLAVNAQVAQRFVSATDEKAKREALALLLNHKYYKMSVITKLAKPVISKISELISADPSEKFDIIKDNIDPNIIENHPAGILAAAKNEFARNNENKENADYDKKQKAINKNEKILAQNAAIKDQQDRAQGVSKNETLDSAIMKLFITKMNSPAVDIAKSMIDTFTKAGHTEENILAAVKSLVNSTRNDKLGEIEIALAEK